MQRDWILRTLITVCCRDRLGCVEGITLRKKDLSDRKNFESLLVEEAENLIGESLFEMIKIGVGFKWFAWVRRRNDFVNISKFCCVEFEIKLRKSVGEGWILSCCCSFWCEFFWFGIKSEKCLEPNISKTFLQIFFNFEYCQVRVVFFRSWEIEEISHQSFWEKILWSSLRNKKCFFEYKTENF